MAKKQTVTTLKKKLWTIYSRYVRLRDAVNQGHTEYARCITCNKLKHVKELQAGHLFSRRHSSTLFHEKNVHAQCGGCNMINGGEQYIYAQKVDKLYGEGTAEYLDALRHETKKFSRPELLEMIEDYNEKFAILAEKCGNPWKQ